MDTGLVTIQEPVSTKTHVGEAPAGVILDDSSMEVHKVKLSTVLDDEITSGDCRNNIIPGETNVSEIVNGSGDKETEELKREKVEATKTMSIVEDTKIVSETEKDEQGSIFVHEPESLNKDIEDAKIILSDVTLEKEKEVNITGKPEEVSVEKPVIEEDHTETKHSPEQEDEIGNISKAPEEIPVKTDEVKVEKDSRTVETSVNGTESEHDATVSVEEISRNGDNIVNETVPEKETATDGESLHVIETTHRALPELEKEEDKEETNTDEEPRVNAMEKVETETVKTVIEEPEIIYKEETAVLEPVSMKENAEPVEAIKNSDDAEQISHEVTVDKVKEEDITQKTEEVQEIPSVIETSTLQAEDIEPKASLETKEEVYHSSNDTEEHEPVLGRDVPQCENLEVEAEETKEETKPSLDLKEDKEKVETETVKTVNPADEVRSSAVQEEEFGEHTEPLSSEIKEESHGREESVEVISWETVQEEKTEEKHEVLLDVPSTESKKYQDSEPETAVISNTEEKFEEIPSDLASNIEKNDLQDEKINVDKTVGTQNLEEQRGLATNREEAEQIDQNITDETEEIPVAKPVALPDVESVEKMQKSSVESPSEVSEESSKTLDEKIEEKPEEEEVTLNQEGQVDGSCGLLKTEETVSVPKSSEPGEKAEEESSVIDMTPLQEESSPPNEQKEEKKLEKCEPANEEVKSDEVIEVSSAPLSKDLDVDTVFEAEKMENKKENEEEPAAVDNMQKILETVVAVEPHSSLPSSSAEQEHETASEKIEEKKVEEEPMVQIKTHERQEEVPMAVEEQTIDIEPSLTEICSRDQNQPEEQVEKACSRDEQEKEISSNSESIANETYALHSAEAAEEETATNGELLHDVETTKRVLLEVEKEEEEAELKIDAEPRLDAIEIKEIESEKTVSEDKIVNNEEATVHESESLKGDDHQGENAESVEAIKNSDDAEKISSEVTKDIIKDEDITQTSEAVQECPRVIEIPTTQGDNNESKASQELKEEEDQSSKDTEQHEHVLERDIPQCETLEGEAVDTSTVQEAAILNTLETNISETETEAVHSEMSLDLKVDKEQKEAETVKTVIFSDEVRPSDQVDVQAEEFGEHTEPRTFEISQGREESVEVDSKDIVQSVNSEEKDVNLLDIQSGESEKYQENESVISLVSKMESEDKFEESVETNHNQTLVDVESVEKVQKPALETLPEPSEETSKTSDEKIEDKPIEEFTLHQEGRDEGSDGFKKTEETVSEPERELGEKPQEEESCLQNEQEKEVELQKEQLDKHEPSKEEVSNDQQCPVEEKSDEVIQVSSASPSEGPKDETVVEAEKIGEELVADKIQKDFESAETSSLPSSLEEKEHVTVPEKKEGEEVKDAELTGDMSEKDLEISETTHLSLPAVDEKEDVKAKEIQIPSVTLPLDDQEKVNSTENGETKTNETEDNKPDEHVDSSTLPTFSEKNDDETLIGEAKKGDEEITVGTSRTSQNVCMQQEDFEKLETPKLDESKEDKSQDIAEPIKEVEATSDQALPIENSHADITPSSELVSELDDQTPKQIEDIDEKEHKVEATEGDRNLPVDTSEAYQTPSSDFFSALNGQTPKQVEETHEEERKEEHKLHAEEILPTEIIPRELSDDALVSMLACTEDGQVTLQDNDCVDDVRETKDTQEERPVSVEIEESVGETKPKEPEDAKRDEHFDIPTSSIILEKNDNETQIVEAKKGDEDINETETTVALEISGTSSTSENMSFKQEEFGNPEAPKLEDSKEKIQEIPETDKAIDATNDQILPVEISQEYHTPSSDSASKKVDEVHEEETKEEHTLQVAVDQIILAETSEADQILFKTAPRESFSEAPVSMLASGEDEPVIPQEDNSAIDTLEEKHVSMETEEKVGETKPKESEAEGTEKSDDQVETSTKFTEVEDESTEKTDVAVAELTNDYPPKDAENGDDTYSTLPVVGILTELQNTFETERTINDSASAGDNMIKEPSDQEQHAVDAGVESNDKDPATEIIEANRLQQDESEEAEKIQEENGLAGKSLPIEEINLQEEHKEEVKVQDGISREYEFNVEEKLQEETSAISEYKEEIPADQTLTEVLPGEKILIPSSALPSDELEDVISPAKQEEYKLKQDINASKSEKLNLQEEQKGETHETVKEENQIADIKDEIKNEEEQEIISSDVNKDIEDASELGLGNDFVSRGVEKEELPHSVPENDEEINEVVKSEKQITDPVGVITKASEAEHASNEVHVETQAIPDDTKSNDNRDFSTEVPKVQREEVSADKCLTKEVLSEELQVPSSTVLDDLKNNSNPEAERDLSVQKPSELIQSHQSPNQVEETSFEVKKAQEDTNTNALITHENVQVKDQPKEFEAPAMDKETPEQEHKSIDLTDVQIRGGVQDIGKNVKSEVLEDEIIDDDHDSVVALKEETGLVLTKEKSDAQHVKTVQEDAIKHGDFAEEKKDTFEKIDHEAAKEICQEEIKQTYTVEEEIREELKETNQDCFNNVKNTHDAIEKTQPEIQDIESLSSVSKPQDKTEQKDEVTNQQEREITNEVPKLENPKIAEELQQKDGESENTKDLFSEVKETGPTLKEPARKSLSDLIQKVEGINKTEDATTETHIKEEPKTVEEDENEDADHEHDKDDKTSPDSIVMVEAKDTVSIIKTQKKSQGILSGVGSKVKHSISKVKKVLTGKSSHPTKPSSPK
ncbi:hypothetical protein CARUB_v10003962mg [Capsella rubella]|uniref:Uncharacterized protein n=1 Tax=Capsella rubella TaxID=81985 RepID=R0GXK9_9BRAS|nr:hypothetical protein CARUB_v10003962mg [Capsella rubella]